MRKSAMMLIFIAAVLYVSAFPLYETQTILNPNSRIIPEKTYQVSFEMLPVGGLAAGVNFSLFPRMMFGVSYSATDIVSYGRPVFSRYPGFLLKVSLVEEEDYVPQVTFGIASQGFGEYSSSRYLIKSKGFFLNSSKVLYPPYGELLLGGGVNYSIFENGTEKFPDIFLQMEYFMEDEFGILAEYTLALDDRLIDGAFGRGYGYLNAGLRWIYMENLSIDLNVIDILGNNESGSYRGRSVKITYTERF